MSGENFQIQYNVYHQVKRSKYNMKNCKEFDEENSIENSSTQIPLKNTTTTNTVTTATTTITTETVTPTTTTTISSAGPSCESIPAPSTSQFKLNNSEDKPVSQFYQSLLESSYTNDGRFRSCGSTWFQF